MTNDFGIQVTKDYVIFLFTTLLNSDKNLMKTLTRLLYFGYQHTIYKFDLDISCSLKKLIIKNSNY